MGHIHAQLRSVHTLCVICRRVVLLPLQIMAIHSTLLSVIEELSHATTVAAIAGIGYHVNAPPQIKSWEITWSRNGPLHSDWPKRVQ